MYFVIVTLLALSDLLFWWWADTRLKKLRNPRIYRILTAALLGSQFCFLALWIIFPSYMRLFSSAFWKPVTAWLYMWHILILPATILALLLGYIAKGLVQFFAKSAQPIAVTPPPAAETHSLPPITGPTIIYPSRRQVLASAATFLPHAALAGTLLASATQIGKFRLNRMTIPVPNLPPALAGLTITHISDTHIGRFVGQSELDSIAQLTSTLKPDLIAFTGDLIDFNLCDLPAGIAFMRDLPKLAPTAMCVGNHDLFVNGQEFRRRVRTAELGLMVDETMPLTLRGQKIELLGLDWGAVGNERIHAIEPHMASLLNRRQTSGFPILLAHHPHAFDPATAAQIPLTLSGHTHGGQLMLTKNIGAGRVFKYWSGQYTQNNSQLIVSNGVGNWFPLRINAPAEVVHITLTNV